MPLPQDLYEKQINLSTDQSVIYEIPIVEATEKSLRNFGTIVTDFEKAEVELVQWPHKGWRSLMPGSGFGLIVEDTYHYRWEGELCYVLDGPLARTEGAEVIGRLPADISAQNRTCIITREANYHPDSGQIFFPKTQYPFVALLAPPVGDDVKLTDFKAFYFDGSFGLNIYPCVWHQPLFPISDRFEEKGKQGSVMGSIAIDTVEEFGKWMKVPLAL